ncbi:hypothetical protein ACFE04_005963 [Oxalis oulophora]
MECFNFFRATVFLVTVALLVLGLPVFGQVTTPCSPTMISSVTPCMNFLSNSTANSTSPSADCCNSLKSLTSKSMDCLCLIVTASVPFQVPINRTLTISLPRACNMPGVPLQCNASRAPAPAPGPAALFGPTLSPQATPSPGALVTPGPTSSAQAPLSDTTLPSPPVTSDTPGSTTTGRSRSVDQPTSSSAAKTSYHSVLPTPMLFSLGYLLLKCYY